MPKLAKKDVETIVSGLEKYRPILENSLQKDLNKSDTILIVNDMLQEIFGFDKYSEIKSDYFINTTFCDLALYISNKLSLLIEVKAIGIPLKYDQIRNARKYAFTKGIEYVILTNGNRWKLYECNTTKIRNEDPILEFDLVNLDIDEISNLKKVFSVTQKGIKRSIAREFKQREELLNRNIVGALMLSDNFISTLRKELKKIDPNFYYENSELKYLLRSDILKRDLVESSDMNKAIKRIKDAEYTINKRPKSTRPIKTPQKVGKLDKNMTN